MIRLKSMLWLGLCFLTFWGCELVEPKIDNDTMLDGNKITDTAHLLSDSVNITGPDDPLLDVPVLIAAHGFTATSFEWFDFAEHIKNDSGVLVSRVLLGGHGLSYAEFKESTWKDWQKPILDEYKKLSDLGFKHISLAGSSTGGALITDLLANNRLDTYTKPEHIFMVDAIVVPGAKVLSLIDIVGPILGNNVSESDTEEENIHWYTNRPQEALRELMDVITVIREQLEQGITLPKGTQVKIYKSMGDKTVDPISAMIMYRGFNGPEGEKPEVELVDSDLHVYTRLSGRSKTPTKAQIEQAEGAFEDMVNRLKATHGKMAQKSP